MKSVEYIYDVTNDDGIVVRHTKTVRGDIESWGEAEKGARWLFFNQINPLLTWVNTLGVQIIKATLLDVDEEWENVSNLNEEKRGTYRVVLTGTMDNGTEINESKQYIALSGADAKRQFWTRLKAGGAGFCDTAAQTAQVTLTVQRLGGNKVLLDRSTEKSEFAGPSFRNGEFEATLNEDKTRAKLTATMDKETAFEIYWALSRRQSEEGLKGDADDLLALVDELTDEM